MITSVLPPVASKVSESLFWKRLRQWALEHERTLKYVLPFLAVFTLIRFWNLSGTLTVWNDDEGTYVAQAWALLSGDPLDPELAHYTYWWDHPPFGWIQIAAWEMMTNAFGRNDVALLVGRELVAVYAAISGVLLYVLCRRMGMLRVFSVIAVGLFMLSPLSMSWGRMAFLDNLAMPWILGAMVVALSPSRSTKSAHIAGYLLAGAILTKETLALFVPIVLWMLWQNSPSSLRVKNLIRTLVSLVSICLMTYVLLAFIKGEIFPGEGHTSLVGSLMWQLFERDGSGSILDPNTVANQTAMKWLKIDPFLFSFAALLLPIVLLRARLRPIMIVALLHVALLLRTGYLPIPYTIILLPLAAIMVAGALDVLWQRYGVKDVRRHISRAFVGVVAIAFVVGALPSWLAQMEKALTIDDTIPLRSAVKWIQTEAPASSDERIVSDDSVWPDLILRGYDRYSVDWFYKLDNDTEVMARYIPAGGTASDAWRSIDYVVIPDVGQAVIDSRPSLKTAIENGTLVATFGEKPNLNYYEIYRVQGD